MPNVFPVIHVEDPRHAYAQGLLALSLGADGLFLIAHSQKNEQLAPLAAQLKEKFPDKKIGANYLGYRVSQAFETAQTRGFDMLWLDAPGIHSSCVDEQAVYLSGRLQGTSLEIFASVAFKYQPLDQNPGLAACKARLLGFVPTTSGVATGVAPDLAKTSKMRSALNSLPEEGRPIRLALASGATCQNVTAFKTHITDFLVATGISSDFHTLDPDKLAAFLQLAKS